MSKKKLTLTVKKDRNPLVAHIRMKSGGAHGKTFKAKRTAEKVFFKKSLTRDDE